MSLSHLFLFLGGFTMSNVIATPLSYFDSRIHLAKTPSDAQEAIANASMALEAYSASTEKRDMYRARFESESDELLKELLADKLRTMKSSDSEARKVGHVAGCKVIRAYIAHLEATYCAASSWSEANEEAIADKLNGLRQIMASNPLMFVVR